jgi:excisionase family DNA binding protein
MTDSSKLLLTRREVAKTLGVSVDTVANLLTAGELKAVRIGNSVLIPRRDIEALVARGTAKTRSSKP